MLHHTQYGFSALKLGQRKVNNGIYLLDWVLPVIRPKHSRPSSPVEFISAITDQSGEKS